MAHAFEDAPQRASRGAGPAVARRPHGAAADRTGGRHRARFDRAALQIPALVARLHDAGCTVGPIAALVQGLSTPLFERAWRIVAPAELVANSCLFVMGSEGRGEQILKTDQDNGLVLREGSADTAAAAGACARFSEALRAFGYPECPGGIMVSNPSWRQGVDDFSRTARRWLLMPDAEGLMSLAIFLDARPVCGDAALLERVRDEIFELAAGSDAMLGRSPPPSRRFPTAAAGGTGGCRTPTTAGLPSTSRGRGLFPLVHGVRSLALAFHVRETSTVGRIGAMRAAGGALSPELARDLVDSLHFFMEIKLKAGLAPDERESAASNAVRLDRLATLDRSRLDAALGVVRQFKALLRQRFHLDVLS